MPTLEEPMHMPSLGVVRHNVPIFVSPHERLIRRGKIKMQAYVAPKKTINSDLGLMEEKRGL